MELTLIQKERTRMTFLLRTGVLLASDVEIDYLLSAKDSWFKILMAFCSFAKSHKFPIKLVKIPNGETGISTCMWPTDMIPEVCRYIGNNFTCFCGKNELGHNIGLTHSDYYFEIHAK